MKILDILYKKNSKIFDQLSKTLLSSGKELMKVDDADIKKLPLKESLKTKKDNILKIWCNTQDSIIACTVGNQLVDENFNWHTNVKRGVLRDNTKLIGSKKDIEYWIEEGDSYIYEVGSHTYQILLADIPAIEGAGAVKTPTRRERHEQIQIEKLKKLAAEELIERNKAEAIAQQSCQKQTNLWKNILKKIIDTAETYEEAKDIVRSYTPAIASMIGKYEDTKFNTSGLGWVYQRAHGQIDYNSPIGVPAFPQNYNSFLRYVEDVCKPLFEQWVRNGKKSSDVERSVIIPVAIVTDQKYAIYPDSGNFAPTAVNSILFNTSGGLNPNKTERQKAVAYILAEDCKNMQLYSFRKI